jgi:nucleoside-diphosphate-sugar epimerase/2-polyprenyl-3-methyl-5-hydroxy-6-metoxy-1,4-benzoquinol methylase
MDKRNKRRIGIAVVVCSILGAIHILDVQTMSIGISFDRSGVNSLTNLLFSSSTKHITIIGSSGYIGARLLRDLQGKTNWRVIGYDRIFSGQASYEISTQNLRKFQVVIYLGGLTGRVMCQERPDAVKQENVDDIYNLAKRMLSSQLLIFASTSAIAEGSGSVLAAEDSLVRPHLLDSYTASMLLREITLRNLSFASNGVPKMIGLRFGTVVGLSDSQRIDLAHMALVCHAFLNGKVHVTHPETNRAFLCLEDLIRAVTVLIERSKNAKRFDIFHLQSFSTSISNVANTIASRTRVHIHVSDHPVNKDSLGFALNATKFRTMYNFTFEGKQDQVIERLVEDVPRMCLGRQSRRDNHSTSCVVCGSRVMHTVLDLNTQPLANDFRNRTEESEKCERFPLHLVRCPKCHHTQLSYFVERAYLFSHYLYQSGTSQSMKVYFEWLAKKIIGESDKTNGTVLELACNDGSQLNQFSKHGWKTIGVDPAGNLAEIARKQGHIVYTGFWGVDKFAHLPSPDTLDVIIAQNVVAHVENPVQFLNSCAAAMSVTTKLYIQTSQCEMYETGQFDTIYHEHISFFTAHSFKKIADIVGLKIVNFEITQIHGRSCLVTFQRMKISSTFFNTVFRNEDTPSLSMAIHKERNLGVTETWFYVKYQAQAQAMRQWIIHQLAVLDKQGHTIVAYGAAAKGMVLLHFLLASPDRTWNISYVIDDAPLKQNTFCPGTSIPVLPASILSKHDSTKPLTIIVFAWNFWEEISKRIRKETLEKGISKVFVILPFPHQQFVKLEPDTTLILTQNTYKPLAWPSVSSSTRR